MCLRLKLIKLLGQPVQTRHLEILIRTISAIIKPNIFVAYKASREEFIRNINPRFQLQVQQNLIPYQKLD